VLVATVGRSVFGNAHNVAIDTGTGILYACGTNVGMPMFDLKQSAVNPPHIGTYTGVYVHDCHVQDGWAHIGAVSNGRYEILDVTNLPSTTSLGRVSVSSAHNAWPSRDNTIAVVSSEAFNPGVSIVDISNKRLPVKVATYQAGSSSASAHNAYLRDRVMHVSYYSEGYRGVDVSDPTNPVQVAHYDTTSSSSGFSGAWGCYPFQPSGAIYISDMSNGLFVLSSKGAPGLYGDGTPGAGGRVPAVHAFGAAFQGNQRFKIELEGASPSAPVLLVVGVAAAELTVQGAEVLVDPTKPIAVIPAQTDAAGNAAVALPVPGPDVGSVGVLFAQWLIADGQATGGVATSRGMRFEVFRR
jgi:hypothetical protein